MFLNTFCTLPLPEGSVLNRSVSLRLQPTPNIDVVIVVSIQTYVHVPDWKIPLTKKGFGDGQRAGEKIKEHIGDKPLFIYTSPYLRTKQV